MKTHTYWLYAFTKAIMRNLAQFYSLFLITGDPFVTLYFTGYLNVLFNFISNNVLLSHNFGCQGALFNCFLFIGAKCFLQMKAIIIIYVFFAITSFLFSLLIWYCLSKQKIWWRICWEISSMKFKFLICCIGMHPKKLMEFGFIIPVNVRMLQISSIGEVSY